MSFYTFIVLEVKKEVYSRLFNYWVTEHWENYYLRRPESMFDTGDTIIMTSVMNHAPYIGDVTDWLSYTLGMDYGDFCIVMCPESYTTDLSKIKDDRWNYYTDSYEKEGHLEPSFVVTNWEKIDFKAGITPTSYTEVFRRPEPSNDTEKRLNEIEKTLKEILEAIRYIGEKD